MKKLDMGISPKDKFLLDSLDSKLYNFAMENMQKLQCNSRYVRYKSPCIVSARISPDYLKYIEAKEKISKKTLPPIDSLFAQNVLQNYGKFSIETKSFKEKNSSRTNLFNKEQKDFEIDKEKNLNFLEITGLSGKLQRISENPVKKRKKVDLEYRRMSISYLENEKRARYYERYYEKERKVSMAMLLQKEPRVKELKEIKEIKVITEVQKKSRRSKTKESHYVDDSVVTCEISLQTPSYFHNTLPDVLETVHN